jgi:hypothetical protein
MSNSYFDLKWKDAISDLAECYQTEMMPFRENVELGIGKAEKSSSEWLRFYSNLYISYIQCYKKLELAYDQMVHPQKRIILRQMLEKTILRLLEMKKEMISFNVDTSSVGSDFINLDEMLFELKILPEKFEIPVPRFFKDDNPKMFQERDQLLDKLLLDYADTNLPEEEVIVYQDPFELTLENAIWTIQKNERGRQGIEVGLDLKQQKRALQKKQLRTKNIAEGIDIDESNETDEAMVVIQKYYRGYKARAIVELIREDEMIFLGMKKERQDETDPESDAYQVNKIRERNKFIQNEHDTDLKETTLRTKTIVLANEGPEIKEKLLNDRRSWIIELYERTEGRELPKKIEEYYERENVALPPSDAEAEAKKKADDDKKKGGKDKKPAKDKKNTPEDVFAKDYQPRGPETSGALMPLQELIEKYNAGWSEKDETNNFKQKCDKDLVMKEVMPKIEEEITVQVDELIKIELSNLYVRLGISKKKVRERVPRHRIPRYRPAPGEKLVGARDPKELMIELINSNILKKLPQARIKDFVGDYNY